MSNTQGKASYKIHARRCHVGAAAVGASKSILNALLGVTTHHDMDREDLHSLAARVEVELGHAYTRPQVEAALAWCVRLHRDFGGLKNHARATGILTVRHMVAMEQVFQCVDQFLSRRVIGELDDILIAKFTPTIPNQDVPTPAAIKAWLKNLLRGWIIERKPEDEDGQAPSPRQHIEATPSVQPGMQIFTAELCDLDAAAIINTINAYAKEHDIPAAKALLELVCNTSDGAEKIGKLVLFGLGKQQPNTKIDAAWLYGIGPLTKAQRARLANVKVDYKDAYEIAKQCSAKHDPTEALRFLVQLRDLTCRFPGCTVEAHRCDIDHVINHEAGGWTTLSNLQCLCRNHHNAKTDRRVHATMTATGEVTWYRADGSLIATTVPTGPLAHVAGIKGGITTRHSGKTANDDNTEPPQRDGLGRWGYTIEQKQQRIRNEIAQHNKRVAQQPPPPDP